MTAPPKPNLWVIPACLLVLVGSTWLRLHDLDTRPLHFDKGTNARILATLLETHSATFDPAHNHGPLLSLAASPIARIRGENTWDDLTKASLRLPVALCGLATVLAALFAAGPGRREEGFLAAAFVSTSPLLVYYSRMFIHEPLFIFCGILTLLGLLSFFHRPTRAAAISIGLGAGLMAATRETVVICLLVWAVVTWVWYTCNHGKTALDDMIKLGRRHLGWMLATMMLVIGLFYSDFGQNLSGIQDFFATFSEYKTVEGHEKPTGYFLELLVWPKHRGGLWWTEAGVLLFALYAFFHREEKKSCSVSQALLLGGILHLLIFSLISYKTPWLASLGWLHICLAAGIEAGRLCRETPLSRRVPALALLVLVLSWQIVQSHRAVFRFASDNRNPYAYVPTSTDVERMAAWLERLADETPELNQQPVAVVGSFYWPLPWYLRGFKDVGYWPALPEDAAQRPLLLLVSGDIDSLEMSHELFPRGLRFEVPVTVAIRKDLWETPQ